MTDEEQLFKKLNEVAHGQRLEHVMTAAVWLLSDAFLRFIEAEDMTDEGAAAFAKLGSGQVYRMVVQNLKIVRANSEATRH